MSSSLVSGPYASAVSIKFTPSSTARLRTFSAFCRSAGQPQIPSPVTRIAPKPRRLTVKSPPKLNVGFVAIFDDVAASPPRIISDLPARSAAPLAMLIPTNLRRVTQRSGLRPPSSFVMTRGDKVGKRFSNARRGFRSCTHNNVECVSEIFAKSDNAGLVPGHHEDLFASHIGVFEKTNDFVRHFRCAVGNRLRCCRSAIEKRRPQIRVVTMNDRRGGCIGFVNRSMCQ